MYNHVQFNTRYETLDQFLTIHAAHLTVDQINTLRQLNVVGRALDQFDWDFNFSENELHLVQQNVDARAKSTIAVYPDGSCSAYVTQIGKARVQYIDFLACLLFLSSNRAGKHIETP